MITITKKTLTNYTFIDLFSGLGGFRLALESLGAKCLFSSDIDTKVSKVYAHNFNDFPKGDITQIEASEIPNHDILCAGFPCQAFSISGKRLGFKDTRGTLFFDVARIVKEKKPKVIFLENVKNFATHEKGTTLKVVQATLNEVGYKVFYQILNATHYGIPQHRERIYIVAFRNDLNINFFSFPTPIKHETSVENILLDHNSIDLNSLIARRNDININKEEQHYSTKTVRIGTVNKGGQGERIYSIKGSSITLSASGGGVFAKTGGYLIDNEIRRLHPRECARLMGFPDNYQLSDKPNQAYHQLGNSVVIDVIQYIAIQISKYLPNKNIISSNQDKRNSTNVS